MTGKRLLGVLACTVCVTSAAALLWAGPASEGPSEEERVKAFLEAVAKQAAAAEREEKLGVEGEGDWLFFVPELRAMSVGPFWGEHAKKVCKASREEWRDPMPVIVDFHKQLEKAGIELLVVPVPAKASIYPGMLAAIPSPEVEPGPPPRTDIHHQAFYELLRKEGVQVLDPYDTLLANRQNRSGIAYCQTDTHWSGRGCELTAALIHEHVKDRKWLEKQSRKAYATAQREVRIQGDIVGMLGEDKKHEGERLTLTFVGTKSGDTLKPLEDWRESPVLLMGDSHTLVFHIPDLHARGAGLADHLAHQFGFPMDLIGVRGSAASATRIALYRRRDQLAGKKLVVWCFSMREFTESFSGWRPLTIIK